MKSLSKQVLFQVDEEDWEEVKKCTLKSKPHFHKRTICSNKINSIMLLYFRNALETLISFKKHDIEKFDANLTILNVFIVGRSRFFRVSLLRRTSA